MIQLRRPIFRPIIGCAFRATDKQALALQPTLDGMHFNPGCMDHVVDPLPFVAVLKCAEETNGVPAPAPFQPSIIFPSIA